MFTSGSTGRPKPVAVPHRGVVRLALSDPDLPSPGPDDRVVHAYGLSSDASTIEIWSALLGGACVVIVDREELLTPSVLEQRLRDEAATIAYLTTSVFHHVARTLPHALSTLRFVSAGGEAMDAELTRAVLRACPGTDVANLYGPTENTVVSTVHLVRGLSDDARSVPIGRPLANSTCLVVRPDGAPASPGEEGELLVGGDGLEQQGGQRGQFGAGVLHDGHGPPPAGGRQPQVGVQVLGPAPVAEAAGRRGGHQADPARADGVVGAVHGEVGRVPVQMQLPQIGQPEDLGVPRRAVHPDADARHHGRLVEAEPGLQHGENLPAVGEPDPRAGPPRCLPSGT
jgi:hypothetical protein